MHIIHYSKILSIFIGLCNCDNVGWTKYFEENNKEFHNLQLKWEMGEETTVPSWLSGVYIRNGMGQATFGSERRHLSHWLDAFAKLHSFKFNGKDVFFSGKMIQSTTYMDSLEKGELAPMMLLGGFQNPEEDEWNMREMKEIAEKAKEQFDGDMKHNAFDNFNPAVWRMGSKDNPVYMAVTDFPFVQKFNLDTLDTLDILRPSSKSLSGVTHWMREPGTDNSLYPMVKSGETFLLPNYVEVQRFTPNNTDFSNPEVVATFNLKKMSMQHSFSITENFAIFLYSPVVTSSNPMCMMKNQFHIMDCVEVLEDEETDIYVVNLKTKEVQEISAKVLFAMHHINAYEINKGTEIVLDLSPTDELGLKTYPLLDNMMNPPENSTSDDTSTCGAHEVTRYHINLETNEVTPTTFPNLLELSTGARFVNKFDMSIINEAFRGREYCIIYGVSAFDYSRTALVKKNVCDATKDKVLYTENHYTSELYFMANPEGSEEDDGVLISVVFDGLKEQTYLLLLDAKHFEEIDRAYLPHNIPFPLSHGMHFPEAKWTL